VAVMLKNKLLEAGISADQIEVIPDEQEATLRSLEMALPGDLVLILGDNTTRAWKQIIYFNSGAHATDPVKKKVVVADLPNSDEFELAEDLEIISDERGVRIARDEGD